MNATLDRIAAKLSALITWFNESRPASYGIEHGFECEGPTTESNVERLELEFGISLPSEYRSFLLRFGDGQVGPGWFRRGREALTSSSRLHFPLAQPLLGSLSAAHQHLSEVAQSRELGSLMQVWDAVPKDDGVLSICNYGCSIEGALILNGPFRGRVWIQHADTAYYGPFGGSEGLHDEFAPCEWTPTDAPRDYTYFEWYESWLNGQLKSASLEICKSNE